MFGQFVKDYVDVLEDTWCVTVRAARDVYQAARSTLALGMHLVFALLFPVLYPFARVAAEVVYEEHTRRYEEGRRK